MTLDLDALLKVAVAQWHQNLVFKTYACDDDPEFYDWYIEAANGHRITQNMESNAKLGQFWATFSPAVAIALIERLQKYENAFPEFEP